MRKRLFIDNFLFRLLVPPIYGVLVYIIILLLFNSLDQLSEHFFSREVLVTIVLTILLLEGINGLKTLLARYCPINQRFAARLALQLGISAVYSIALVSGLLWIYFTQIEGFSSFTTELLMFNGIYLVSAMFYNLLYFSLDFLNKQNDDKLSNEKKRSESLEIDFQNYRNDLNPELLIASLETLISFIQTQPHNAETLVENLSEVYRYVLSTKASDLVKLTEELKALDGLLHVLNAKYDNHIQLTNELTEFDEVYIVPCTLLILLERAVNRSIVSANAKIKITINGSASSQLMFKLEANERLTTSTAGEEKLDKINNAFSYFTGKRISFEKDGMISTMTIPKIFIDDETNE